MGLLINKPSRVQRKDGVRVDMSITNGSLRELQLTAKLFFSKSFLLIVPLIGQGVYTEAVMFTYESLWFSVRARALGSFLSGIVAIIAGNILGAFLDRQKLTLRTRARGSFFTVLGLQGAWWIPSQRTTGATRALGRRLRSFCYGWLGFSLITCTCEFPVVMVPVWAVQMTLHKILCCQTHRAVAGGHYPDCRIAEGYWVWLASH